MGASDTNSATGVASARIVGALVLAIPGITVAALGFFPSYDARSEYFVASYNNIVDAGNRYLLSLLLFFALATVLTVLAFILWREPAAAGGAVEVAVGAFAVSAAGFAAAAIAGLPVWALARSVVEGSETMLAAAERSSGLASFSQTLILVVGLGGLVVAMIAMGVASSRGGWIPRPILWVAAGAAGTGIIVGFALTLFWFALGIPALILTLTIGASLLIRGRFA